VASLWAAKTVAVPNLAIATTGPYRIAGLAFAETVVVVGLLWLGLAPVAVGCDPLVAHPASSSPPAVMVARRSKAFRDRQAIISTSRGASAKRVGYRQAYADGPTAQLGRVFLASDPTAYHPNGAIEQRSDRPNVQATGPSDGFSPMNRAIHAAMSGNHEIRASRNRCSGASIGEPELHPRW